MPHRIQSFILIPWNGDHKFSLTKLDSFRKGDMDKDHVVDAVNSDVFAHECSLNIKILARLGNTVAFPKKAIKSDKIGAP